MTPMRLNVFITRDIDRMMVQRIINEMTITNISAGASSPLLIYGEVRIYFPHRRQYPVEKLVDMIECFVLGSPVLLLTDLDIYYADLDYVFGYTDVTKKISVVSLARLKRGVSTEKLVDRTVKTAIHEIGHLKGLRHCNNKRCVMFLSFGIGDTDRKDRRFCDKCSDTLLKKTGGFNETRHSC